MATGKSTLGNRSTPRLPYETIPSTTGIDTSTQVKTGRLMQISEMVMVALVSGFGSLEQALRGGTRRLAPAACLSASARLQSALARRPRVSGSVTGVPSARSASWTWPVVTTVRLGLEVAARPRSSLGLRRPSRTDTERATLVLDHEDLGDAGQFGDGFERDDECLIVRVDDDLGLGEAARAELALVVGHDDLDLEGAAGVVDGRVDAGDRALRRSRRR